MSDLVAVAWIPLIDPLPSAGAMWWLLAIPLALGISMIHKAWRMPTLDGYGRQVLVMTTQIVVAMFAMALGLGVLIQVVLPMLPAD